MPVVSERSEVKQQTEAITGKVISLEASGLCLLYNMTRIYDLKVLKTTSCLYWHAKCFMAKLDTKEMDSYTSITGVVVVVLSLILGEAAYRTKLLFNPFLGPK